MTRRQNQAAFSGLRVKMDARTTLDGDKSPAESGVEPPHSKAGGVSP